MMVSVSDRLPLLFPAKLLNDAHLTRNLPTQQCDDLRQSVIAHPKPTGDQEEGYLNYSYMTYFDMVGTNTGPEHLCNYR